MPIVGIGGADANHSGMSTVEGLVGMEPWRRAVARCLHVKWFRVGVLLIADIACGYCSHHTCIQNGLVELAEKRIAARLGIAKRAT